METPGYRVFVGGISWKADEIQLENFFSTHGQVLECKIIMDKATGKSKGYGFVTFKDADAAEFVKQTANFNFLGKNMNVGDAVRKTPEPNGANHNGSNRNVHGNYNNGYGYQPFYNPNYYRNDTQFYGNYSPDGTFHPSPYYYYFYQGQGGGGGGFRGNQQQQPYQYGMGNPQVPYPQPTNFDDQQPSSPDSPQNGFGQFPPNFNPYYYNPYYQYNNGGFGYGPGFNNGGFNNENGETNGENNGNPADPSIAPNDGSQASQGKSDATVHTPVNNPSSALPPINQQGTAQPETAAPQQPASTTDTSTSLNTSTSSDTTSSVPTTSTGSSSTSAASAFEQGSSTYTRSPSKGPANTGIASPKQGVQQRSAPKQQQQPQQQQQQQFPKHKPQQQQQQPQQHKTHRAPQDPALHNHVIAGLSKLSVSSN